MAAALKRYGKLIACRPPRGPRTVVAKPRRGGRGCSGSAAAMLVLALLLGLPDPLAAAESPASARARIEILRRDGEADYNAKRFGDARAKLTEAYTLGVSALGPADPLTLSTGVDMAATLGATGDLVAEEALERRLAATQLATRGERHPDTLTALSNHAATLWQLDRAAEAEPILRRVWTARQQTLGEAADATVDTGAALAGVLCDLFRPNEAEPIARRVWAERQVSLGPEAGKTLDAANLLVGILRQQHRGEDADQLLMRIGAAAVANFSTEDAQTADIAADIAANVALATARLGQPEDGLELLELVYRFQVRSFGEDDRRPLGVLYYRAVLLSQLGRNAEAEPLAERAAETLRRQTQAGAPPSRLQVVAFNGLGTIRGNQGRWSEGYAAYRLASVGVQARYRDRRASGASDSANQVLVADRDIFIDQVASGWQWAHEP